MSGRSTSGKTNKVQRYWPGKAPAFLPPAQPVDGATSKPRSAPKETAPSAALSLVFSSTASDLPENIPKLSDMLETQQKAAEAAKSLLSSESKITAAGKESRPAEQEPISPVKNEPPAVDRRLQRLQRLNIKDEHELNEEEDQSVVVRRRPGRPVFEATVLEQSAEMESREDKHMSDEDEEMQARRARIRARMATREKAAPVIVSAESEDQVAEKSDREEEAPAFEESSEEESSSEEEEEEESAPILFKPMFVPKNARGTIQEAERLDQERLAEEQRQQEQVEVRKKESQQIVLDALKNEIMAAQSDEADSDPRLAAVDDTDGVDPQAEYDLWKLRELKRIKRAKEQLEAYLQEKELTEKRREMTDKERIEDELQAGRDRFKKEKGNQGFLQKYYHKGAFFADEDILKRDYTAPTADEFRKEALPEVMQVKNWGMAGRSKWTHLAKEDTSQRDAAWSQKTDVTTKIMKRMAGMHDQDIDRPSLKKKK